MKIYPLTLNTLNYFWRYKETQWWPSLKSLIDIGFTKFLSNLFSNFWYLKLLREQYILVLDWIFVQNKVYIEYYFIFKLFQLTFSLFQYMHHLLCFSTGNLQFSILQALYYFTTHISTHANFNVILATNFRINQRKLLGVF